MQVLGNASICEQLREWVGSWKRGAAKLTQVQPVEAEELSPDSALSPQNRRTSARDGDWSEVTHCLYV